MTTSKAGASAAACAKPAHTPPPHYARRLARFLILKSAVSGRLSWHVALPILNRIGGGA